jgi:hypothetical protein
VAARPGELEGAEAVGRLGRALGLGALAGPWWGRDEEGILAPGLWFMGAGEGVERARAEVRGSREGGAGLRRGDHEQGVSSDMRMGPVGGPSGRDERGPRGLKPGLGGLKGRAPRPWVYMDTPEGAR